ncbi:MAG: stage II sporulation protein M [Pseudomonadota bacterium]
MKQTAFVKKYQPRWDAFEKAVAVLSAPRKHDESQRMAVGDDFAALYREICHHLALSRSRRYSLDLQHRLNELALQGHRFMYRPRRSRLSALGTFLLTTFPRAFRDEWRYTMTSFALFFVPFFGFIVLLQFFPDLVFSLIDAGEVTAMESMYDPDNARFGRERQSATDTLMFGYYIYNNVGIGFRMFAGGLLFGLGTLFFLLFNGVFLGAVSGHLIGTPATIPFTTFVVAHGAFELTGIAIFGAAGLMVGMALVAPGNTGRWRAAQLAARRSLTLVYGATLMMLLAAFVEAYWSSTSWPPAWTKYTVGAVLWLFVIAYFAFAGRRR